MEIPTITFKALFSSALRRLLLRLAFPNTNLITTFKLNYLPRLISCTATISYLAACSFSSPRTLESNSLATGKISQIPDWSIHEIEKEPPLYRIEVDLSNGNKGLAYAASFTECGLGHTASGLATTRQLLVGLKDITMEKDVRLMDGTQRVVFTAFGGKLDDHKLKLINFAVRKESCVRDITLWSEENNDTSVLANIVNAEPEQLINIYKNLTSVN